MTLPETASSRWAATEGLPFPLGPTKIEEEDAYNFALYSKHAESVTLLLYTESDIVNPVLAYRFDYLKNKTGRIWHCRIPLVSMRGASYYAYSVEGPKPNGRFEWHWFDRDKILLDPYAKSVFFPPAFDRLAAVRPGSNAGKAPLGVLTGDSERFDWQGDHRARHEADTVIYELHVGGFTKNPNSGVRDEARGTFAGLVEKIPYLKDLGVTVVELMPVFQYDPSDGNYWGYMPLNFFSPHHGYLSDHTVKAQHNEVREMIKALHQADIEVVLDVVYNHTGEGDHTGPVYSYKGIDNSTYYLMADRPGAPFENFSGIGNTLNCANRYVRKMIMDSVRHWAHEMHVDGFRFDLASLFTRNPDGSVNVSEAPLLSDMASDPDLAHLRLIAEPWDAAGVYQLGRAFPGIMACQWNGRYRDDLRRFVKGDPGMAPALMRRLYGSDDLFPDDRMNAYHPHQSVNYLASHDGFTLYDLVAYNQKRNWANGHGNTDGTEENHSWNCGWEGDEGVPPEVVKLRKQQIKNFCCLLFLSNGTPMFRAGDEFMHTQAGNNNPYNQDNETAWIDWGRLHANPDIFRFFKLMIAFRKAHPSLARSRFWREDVHWYGVGRDTDLAYDSRSLAFALHGASQQDIDIYVMINAYWEELTFQIQEGATNAWRRVVDTSLESPFDFLDPGNESPLQSLHYRVPGRAVVVLVRDKDGVDRNERNSFGRRVGPAGGPMMATIDIRIQRIDQLFDSLDPSPFHENEKALRLDAENYIVDLASEYGRAEPLRLIVHAPVSIKPHAAEIVRAVHAHFELAHAQCRRRYQRRMRIGRTLLVAGTAVLGIALLLRALLGDPGDRATIVAASEGLLILGWVAMWRPLEILLFERLENHQKSALLHRLAQVPVDFAFDLPEPGQSKTSARP